MRRLPNRYDSRKQASPTKCGKNIVVACWANDRQTKAVGSGAYEGGLNRVPLPDLPPPPARGRTRTLRRNYLASLALLSSRLLVLSSESLISLASTSITPSLGSAWEDAGAARTTFSLTSTSCLISPCTSTSCACPSRNPSGHWPP